MSWKNLPVQDPDRGHSVTDPGMEEHIERFTDADKGAGNRAYLAILAMLGLVPVLAIAFVVIYFAVPRRAYIDFGWLKASAMNVGLGVTAGLAVLLIGLAIIQWSRVLMGDHESVDPRHSAATSPEDRAIVAQNWRDGVEQSAIKRRPLILGALGGALGIAVVPAVVLLADMGPHPTRRVREQTIEKTIWANQVRLVNDENWVELRPEHLEVGQLVNAQPATLRELEGVEAHQAKAKAAIIVVRMDPQSITIPPSRQDWQVSGILAYSKICTHVGCPISLWERQTHHLLCPCHQSTFDLGNSGTVVFGPAARSLPQLPISVDDEGYLIATSDFTVPVGPSYFERDSRNDFQDGDQ
ncbi:ubiquinol-cytochrome c reductase iron-sulfur subunit [Tessaracoccus sp. ZS01]|uniref:cytochrome bc1 complex Rieske iron-sulfur subunit n=1 Tax=Tessaracoccus sp. ZS01 TaxID=1906324 RepID=UPI00096F0993|nr:Rieske 2Fe-2S domain-containing protein [Tessaracoccus sp. ZS01]MCG6566122.1 Rieske (2Fe-2S) protein [Tessaracoccus sp. ZS01]OMG58620.1 ubiquinol-cytochrome C reductase [Tessaracoccus sp. ZS01]